MRQYTYTSAILAKLPGPGGAKAIVADSLLMKHIGFGVRAGDVDGVALCRIFNTDISTKGVPKYLGTDNDPLFQYHQWQANLRILDVAGVTLKLQTKLKNFRWQTHCRGLYQLPAPA